MRPRPHLMTYPNQRYVFAWSFVNYIKTKEKTDTQAMDCQDKAVTVHQGSSETSVVTQGLKRLETVVHYLHKLSIQWLRWSVFHSFRAQVKLC